MNTLPNSQRVLLDTLKEVSVDGRVTVVYAQLQSLTKMPKGTISSGITNLRNNGYLYYVGVNPANKKQPIYSLQALDFEGLLDFYVERMGELQTSDVEGLREYWNMLQARKLDAYHWLREAICIVSKKADEKKNFQYIVGMIRNWLKYGFGNIPSTEEREFLSQVEKKLGGALSEPARDKFYQLMGTYGCIKTLVAVFQVPLPDVDLGALLAEKVEEHLTDDAC